MLTASHLIEAAIKLWGNPTSRKPGELRFGAHGSKSINLKDLTWYDHEAVQGGGVVDLCARAGVGEADKGNGPDRGDGWIFYDYRDERGDLLFQVARTGGSPPFAQRRPNGGGGWEWNLRGVRRVIYRLPELLASEGPVFVCEGEKDVDNVRALGLTATTNAGGAKKWRAEYSEHFKHRDVVILPDNDEAGEAHAQQVKEHLSGVAKRVRVLRLPGLPDKGDVSDWIAEGRDAADLAELLNDLKDEAVALPAGVVLEHFLAYAPEHSYIFIPTGTRWPTASVNGRLPWIGGIKPSAWLDQNKPVEQMTWAPGEPVLIKDKLIVQGGWKRHDGATVFNQYQPPDIRLGDAGDAEMWTAHVRNVYPDEADHIIRWLAFKCQHPAVKINHALLLGGVEGIGKDTLLHPAKYAVGFHNTQSVSPAHMLGRFNAHLKTILLIVTEARDLGEVNRPQFYEHMKTIIAAPPEVTLIDEKNTHPYYVPNVCGVVITTNHKAGGIYLSGEDRRHMICWSDKVQADFDESYWNDIWGFYERGGLADVAAYLMTLDLTGFNPNAPPPKTEAFWEMVAAGRHPEAGELEEALANIGNPPIVTLHDLVVMTSGVDAEFVMELKNRRNRRLLARWFEQAGYKVVNNHDSKQGLWPLNGRKQVVYGQSSMNINDLVAEIRRRSSSARH